VRLLAIAILTVCVLSAADDPQLALILKAQTDFDRVDLSPAPQLPQSSACIQSQAALVPIAAKPDLPIVHFRKGWCTLASATFTNTPALYTDAAAEFQKGIDAWPDRVALQPKKTLPEPLPPALPIMAAIARLLGNPNDPAVQTAARQQIAGALASPVCVGTLMAVTSCQADLQLGRAWLGYLALNSDQLADAAKYFTGLQESGWSDWVAGRQAFQAGHYSAAANQYRSAIAIWQRSSDASLRARFSPPRDLGLALTDLGGAQLLAGDATGAIATLDSAIKADPAHARSFFYRARAKETAGRMDAAIADYGLAARTAFAGTVDLASGDAHLYRGIAAFRRKEFARAEDEFSSALNFSISPGLHADAVAWRHLAAVAAGNCEASRDLLAHDLAAVSPFFPKSEASTLVASCPTASAAK
jgi:tetratricopeptide (TPR) repeat protein